MEEYSTSDYIKLIGMERILDSLIDMCTHYIEPLEIFKSSIKKLYDIDYDDIPEDNPEGYIREKVRNNTINKFID